MLSHPGAGIVLDVGAITLNALVLQAQLAIERVWFMAHLLGSGARMRIFKANRSSLDAHDRLSW